MLFAIGTDTNEFAGYRACKCLNNFYRTHLFEDCKPCDQPGLQCVHDFATLRSGYWWKWRNETDKMIYKTFTEGLKNAGVTPVVRTKNVASEGSYIPIQSSSTTKMSERKIVHRRFSILMRRWFRRPLV